MLKNSLILTSLTVVFLLTLTDVNICSASQKCCAWHIGMLAVFTVNSVTLNFCMYHFVFLLILL